MARYTLAMRRRLTFVFAAAALHLAGCGQNAETPADPDPPLAATFVGGQQCASCHAEESNAWRNSHHDLAMQIATADSIVGDFSGSTFAYNGVTSEFFERDGEYWVRTDGADGTLKSTA